MPHHFNKFSVHEATILAFSFKPHQAHPSRQAGKTTKQCEDISAAMVTNINFDILEQKI